jgi:hypothetical protein
MIEQSSIQSLSSVSSSIPEIDAVYRHYRGNSYRIVAISRHSETHEIHVVYQGLYDSPQFGDHAVWVRPLSLFMDTVVINGAAMPRFSRVD